MQVLKTKYPQGSERQLIYACTGRKINSSMLPADAGCIVDNCDTVISIYRAVCESTPLMRRVVTVTGDAVKKPRNLIVRTGTLYSELLEYAEGFKDGVDPEKILSGGPMMGIALTSLDVPVTKISSAAAVHGEGYGSCQSQYALYPLRTLRIRMSQPSGSSEDV